MRYSTEQKEQTRALVLKEAAKAIRACGPHQVSVADVMAKAGLTHGGFYAHFKSKDDLIAQAIRQMFDESTINFARLTEGRTARAGLDNYLDFYLSPAHRDSNERGCPLPRLSADLPRLSAAARKNFSNGTAELTAAFANALEQAGCANASATASSVLAEMVGALTLARAVSNRAQSDSILDHSRAALKERLARALDA